MLNKRILYKIALHGGKGGNDYTNGVGAGV
jgi:hypothetical protein